MTSRNMGTQGRYATPTAISTSGCVRVRDGRGSKTSGTKKRARQVLEVLQAVHETQHRLVVPQRIASGPSTARSSAHSHRLKALARSSKRRLRARNDAYAGHGLVGSEIKHESARKRKHTRHKGEHK